VNVVRTSVNGNIISTSSTYNKVRSPSKFDTKPCYFGIFTADDADKNTFPISILPSTVSNNGAQNVDSKGRPQGFVKSWMRPSTSSGTNIDFPTSLNQISARNKTSSKYVITSNTVKGQHRHSKSGDYVLKEVDPEKPDVETLKRVQQFPQQLDVSRGKLFCKMCQTILVSCLLPPVLRHFRTTSHKMIVYNFTGENRHAILDELVQTNLLETINSPLAAVKTVVKNKFPATYRGFIRIRSDTNLVKKLWYCESCMQVVPDSEKSMHQTQTRHLEKNKTFYQYIGSEILNGNERHITKQIQHYVREPFKIHKENVKREGNDIVVRDFHCNPLMTGLKGNVEHLKDYMPKKVVTWEKSSMVTRASLKQIDHQQPVKIKGDHTDTASSGAYSSPPPRPFSPVANGGDSKDKTVKTDNRLVHGNWKTVSTTVPRSLPTQSSALAKLNVVKNGSVLLNKNRLVVPKGLKVISKYPQPGAPVRVLPVTQKPMLTHAKIIRIPGIKSGSIPMNILKPVTTLSSGSAAVGGIKSVVVSNSATPPSGGKLINKLAARRVSCILPKVVNVVTKNTQQQPPKKVMIKQQQQNQVELSESEMSSKDQVKVVKNSMARTLRNKVFSELSATLTRENPLVLEIRDGVLYCLTCQRHLWASTRKFEVTKHFRSVEHVENFKIMNLNQKNEMYQATKLSEKALSSTINEEDKNTDCFDDDFTEPLPLTTGSMLYSDVKYEDGKLLCNLCEKFFGNDQYAEVLDHVIECTGETSSQGEAMERNGDYHQQQDVQKCGVAKDADIREKASVTCESSIDVNRVKLVNNNNVASKYRPLVKTEAPLDKKVATSFNKGSRNCQLDLNLLVVPTSKKTYKENKSGGLKLNQLAERLYTEKMKQAV